MVGAHGVVTEVLSHRLLLARLALGASCLLVLHHHNLTRILLLVLLVLLIVIVVILLAQILLRIIWLAVS